MSYFMVCCGRIRKRQSDLTASRGQLIEVNVESAFEPIVQVDTLGLNNIFFSFAKKGKYVSFLIFAFYIFSFFKF